MSAFAQRELNARASPATITAGGRSSAPAVELLFGRTGLILAAILWTVAIVHPPHGLDLPICWWKTTTGLPCPGCGLMRSLSCTIRGMFGPAWQYNPFGPVWLAVASGGAAVRLLSARGQRRVRAWVSRHDQVLGTVYAGFVTAFLVYG
ncbi:MAG TPA: DUF2752 domain-containing protein, partial [Phycisphaerae bacterium]|nr:DUF2752 domain-containing protein [Phycisphaerae bacterium]